MKKKKLHDIISTICKENRGTFEGAEEVMNEVKLVKRYADIGYTGRIVEAGTKGSAYPFNITKTLYKVKVKNQPWGDGEITIRRENLEFLWTGEETGQTA